MQEAERPQMTNNDKAGSDVVPLALSTQDLGELEHALTQVEAGKGVLVRLADLMGGAVGHAARLGLRGLGMAPGMEQKLRALAESAVTRAFDIAVVGLRSGSDAVAGDEQSWRKPVTQAAVAVSGAVGGFTGLAGLAPDIAFTTLTIMREIAHIAREEGEDLSQEDARAACLEVFALRAFPNVRDGDENELGYFSARALLRGRPVVMLIAEVASHYGLALGQKVSLQLMPVAGALCGASLNTAFLNHYRALARAHFTIRRLEREHGPVVRDTALALREQVKK
ncbi:EcsC family protein [Acetobacter thailandicus]|uniref:EcsC family protein n=2 Tax=Acetobacteraceae TaxID=433 RepID=A0ABT3QF37_9PROT|nr:MULTISPECIES: EcsC family protein [Acetobacter]MBS0960032.1 EcsC family protein [Acetobacter thailandicus]MBS0979361.1 EcsC family protein [Acetobacter thailandicus]MBS0985565.1 EcsC family protein [Acetobacter thailandicus]MBS1002480.1 EcsC family protein [Acetobacter thailandicus]MCX2563895.1 EcsC family protein [Acetobacter thailandicus]